jgi:hypothetical protein
MKTGSALLMLFIGFMIGIYMQAQHPGFFRSWDENDKTLYRGDKVTITLNDNIQADFYKGCKATFISSVALSQDNVAWVLLTGCDKQLNGEYPERVTAVFRLRELDRIP